MTATTEIPNRPLTVFELADLLQYHPESLRRAIRQGRIRTILVGRQHRVPPEVVQQILTEGLPPADR